MNGGKLYKLCKQYIRYSNLRFEAMLEPCPKINEKAEQELARIKDEIRELMKE